MKKKAKVNKNLRIYSLLGLMVSLFLIFNILFIKTSPNQLYQSFTNARHTKLYKSETLRISFYYPEDYTVEEVLGIVTLKNNFGKIIVDSNASNYQSIEEYIDYLEQVNNVKIIDRSKISRNNLSSIYGVIQHSGTRSPDSLTYFFNPAKWTVFTISTDSKELKNDLDNIAKTIVFNL
jgi:hypothetical protein